MFGVKLTLRHMQLLQGLLLHPYQTMQEVVERRAFFLVAFGPAALWIALKAVWLLLIVPLVRMFYTCGDGNVYCGSVDFIADVFTFFCLYWQIILLYLFIRFYLLLRDN